jgi:hypothetical protein
MADKFYKETKKHEKREETQIIKLRNAVYEFGKELKRHEKEPMSKAHPEKPNKGASQKDAPLPNMRKY